MYKTRDKLLSEINKSTEYLHIKIISIDYLKPRKIAFVSVPFQLMLCSDTEAYEGCAPPINLFPSDRTFHPAVVQDKSSESARIMDTIQLIVNWALIVSTTENYRELNQITKSRI